MKKWTRWHTLIVGLALILLTNAVALLGVYWNRSGEPESIITLTQRELNQPYGWGMNRETSGMSLRINWRVPLTDEKYWPGSFSGGNPAWLDQAKMASLGFDVSPATDMQDKYRWSNRQLGKEVMLVLEMDGPTYLQALQRAKQNAAGQAAKLAALPDDKGMQNDAKNAHEEAKREEQENSRLFAIDAGLDLPELRAKYPDRSHYAIVRAQVRPWSVSGQGKSAGYVDHISIDQINVPHEYQTAFDTKVRLPIERMQTSGQRTFKATVAFGQRLEPWLVGISAGED